MYCQYAENKKAGISPYRETRRFAMRKSKILVMDKLTLSVS